jgi:hypothetical protein
MNKARLICATMSLLLLEQSKSYECSTVNDQYVSCVRSMRDRYFKRIFICGTDEYCFVVILEVVVFMFCLFVFQGHWLPTLSKMQLYDIQNNHEQYVSQSSRIKCQLIAVLFVFVDFYFNMYVYENHLDHNNDGSFISSCIYSRDNQ